MLSAEQLRNSSEFHQIRYIITSVALQQRPYSNSGPGCGLYKEKKMGAKSSQDNVAGRGRATDS